MSRGGYQGLKKPSIELLREYEAVRKYMREKQAAQHQGWDDFEPTQHGEVVQEEELDEEDGDWSDDESWERMPRAQPPSSGLPMDGADVGCLPERVLRLPHAAVRAVPCGLYGRSMLQTERHFFHEVVPHCPPVHRVVSS